MGGHVVRDGMARVQNLMRQLRTERGLTQAELAEQLNVSRQTVIAIETERYDPSLPLAFAIAKLFGRKIEEIFVTDTPSP
jgi:putative transcriptional regulator